MPSFQMRKHHLIDAVHILLMLSPLLVLIAHLAGQNVRVPATVMLLLFGIVPYVWTISKNCPLTKISQDMGGLSDAKTTSAFSEKYLGWLYFPLIRLSGHEVNSQSMNVASSVHNMSYLLLMTYVISASPCV